MNFFSIFFIENEPNGRTVQPTKLILISIEAEFCPLQNYREFFFSFFLVFKLYIFFMKMYFCLKKLKIQTAYFFSRIRKLKKKLFIAFLIIKFRFFWHQYQSCSSKTIRVQFAKCCKIEIFQESNFSADNS